MSSVFDYIKHKNKGALINVKVYDQFKNNVREIINKDYGIDIKNSNLDIDFMPPYLDNINDDWESFVCRAIDLQVDIQFFCIFNRITREVVEVGLTNFDNKYIA